MKGRRFGVITSTVAVLIGITLTGGYHAGLRFNFTDSAPHGLWLVQSVDLDSMKRGALVEVCPPDLPVVRLMAERGYLAVGDCEGTGVTTLLKPISAVAGDTIELEQGRGVTVNNVALPNTAAMPAIPGWPSGRYVVQPGEIWMFSSYSPGSFDSRYFGPVPLSQVRGLAQPITIAGDPAAITAGVIKQ